MTRSQKRLSIVVCVIGFLFYSCSNSPYKVIGDREYANNDFKYIRISERYSSRYSYISRAINTSNWEGLAAETKLITDLKLRTFLVAVRMMREDRIFDAHKLLLRLDEKDFDCQVGILKADCMSALKVDSTDVRKIYQAAFDCAPDLTIKEIAKTHYRFHLYGM
jgi:hypothetical protein